MLTVTDTGVGMDAETKARCLEPFFTTKAVGQGTGLGLATVSDIIQQSGGRIEVESAVDAGTTMRLYLPQAEPLVQSAPVAASKGGGAKTLLIVDDDAHSRRAMTEILKYKGYRVLEAGSGADAVTMLSERREPVDLLLTDVVMPAMNGRELAARLTELRPGLKIIYVSGYSPDQISNYGVVGSGQTILLKPFTPETLSSRVRTALDAH
jgi:CheY-like chemotaxis protein